MTVSLKAASIAAGIPVSAVTSVLNWPEGDRVVAAYLLHTLPFAP